MMLLAMGININSQSLSPLYKADVECRQTWSLLSLQTSNFKFKPTLSKISWKSIMSLQRLLTLLNWAEYLNPEIATTFQINTNWRKRNLLLLLIWVESVLLSQVVQSISNTIIQCPLEFKPGLLFKDNQCCQPILTEICTADGQNMHKYALGLSKYAQNMHKICTSNTPIFHVLLHFYY